MSFSLSRGLLLSSWRSPAGIFVQLSFRRTAYARVSPDMASKYSTVVPRPSASLIVINPRNEILFVHRNPKSGTFAGMHVFPGGNYDAKQDESLVITAIRETFEETGLLLASSRTGKLPSNEELDAAREHIHSEKQLFGDFLAKHGLTADVSALMPFTQWTTPPTQPRRFETQFYVTFLNTAPSSGFSSGDKLERLPTPDGGQEVVAARFIHPDAALQECAAHQIALMPPQFYLAATLATFLQGTVNTPEQQERVATLSNGAFGKMSIHPRAYSEGAPKGWVFMTYEGDESRGGPKGRLHRSLCKFEKPGVVSEVILQRNFDIFTEVPQELVQGSAKL